MSAWLKTVATLPAALVVGACTVQQTEAPALSGPSGLAQSVTVTATPDTITRDGFSQSSIVAQVTGPDGRPAPNVQLRLDTLVPSQGGGFTPSDFGRLVNRTLFTGSDGRALTTYIAPPAARPGSPDDGKITFARVQATIVGTDSQVASSATAQLRLVPQGVILPPVQFSATFTFNPTAPTQGQAVTFTAQPNDPTGAIVSYAWDFGDGGTAGPSGSALVATHSYSQPGTYTVKLTVADQYGQVVNATPQAVTVSPSPAPGGDWVFSPTQPAPGQVVQFNADGIKAAPGHSIVQYSWIFGDPSSATVGCDPANNGNFGSGLIAYHTFCGAGTYSVTLSVLDDAGQKTTMPKTVTVK